MNLDLPNILIQALVSLVLYLIGMSAIRRIMRRYLLKQWGSTALQVFLFGLILLAFLFITVPPLSHFILIGTVLGVLTIVSLTMLLQESASYGITVSDWFGSDAESTLGHFSGSKSVNRQLLKRLASILKSKGQFPTSTISNRVKIKPCRSDGTMLVYSMEESYSYELDHPIDVLLVVEIRPKWQANKPWNMTFPALPLEYRNAADKWHFGYAPNLRIEDLQFWDQWLPEITVDGQVRVRHDDGEITQKLSFQREITAYEVNAGGAASTLQTRYVQFSVKTKLPQGRCTVTLNTQNIPHPRREPYIYFYAWDLCTHYWEFVITLEDGLYPNRQIEEVLLVTSFGDVNIPTVQNRGDFAQFRIEAVNESVIIPQDAVIVTFQVPADAVPSAVQTS